MTVIDQAPYGLTGDDQPFWDAAAQGTLRFQRCDECAYIRWPAAGVCPECLSRRASWTDVAGEGTLWSHVVYHRAYSAAFAEQIPYSVGLVQLSCGVRLLTRLVGLAPGQAEVGLALTARFEELGGFGVVPVFGPAE